MSNEKTTTNDSAFGNTASSCDIKIEQALDLMEAEGLLAGSMADGDLDAQLDAPLDAPLDAMLSDGDVARSFDDLLLLKRATLASSPVSHANVEGEWQRFKSSHSPAAEITAASPQPVAAASRTRHAIAYTLLGMAATLLLLFGYSWVREASKPVIPGDHVLEAKKVARHPIVTTAGGDEVELDGTPRQQEALAEIAASTDSPTTLTITIPRGQTYHLTLSDGSEVWLNTDCRFSYPSRFSGGERRVSIEGEAYFKVAHDAAHPFIVETAGGMETKVLGTEFNVRSYGKGDSRVTLIKGSVEVRHQGQSGKDGGNIKSTVATRLTPGQEATLTSKGTFDVADVDVDSYIYWKEGFFYFDDITLESIMQDIGRWYNLGVVFQKESAKNYHMHFLADRKDGIDQVVKLLNSMGKVKVVREDNTLVVK